MAPTTSIPRAERAMERLDLLARVGAMGEDGGITRPGLSAASGWLALRKLRAANPVDLFSAQT